MMAQEFEVKDLGTLGYFLGMDIGKNKRVFQPLKANALQINWRKLACWDVSYAKHFGRKQGKKV